MEILALQSTERVLQIWKSFTHHKNRQFLKRVCSQKCQRLWHEWLIGNSPYMIVLWLRKVKLVAEFRRRWSTKSVEDMIVSLFGGRWDNSRLLQKIVRDWSTNHHTLRGDEAKSLWQKKTEKRNSWKKNTPATVTLNEMPSYRKVVYKSGLCAIFNFLLRLLLKYGFSFRAAFLQSPESAKPAKAVGHM